MGQPPNMIMFAMVSGMDFRDRPGRAFQEFLNGRLLVEKSLQQE